MGRGGLTKRYDDKRRGRFDIIADIVDVAINGVKKTRLMYSAGMSCSQLEKYLSLVLNAGLVVVENDAGNLVVRTSGKGKKFLQAYTGLKCLTE